MIKKLSIGIAAIFIIGIATLAYIVAPYVATPKFIVKNETSSSVQVSAYWREESRDLGQLSAGSVLEFEVNDEAAMEFKATFPNDKVLSSSPAVYFTSGTLTKAIIAESTIEVSTQL